MKILLVLVHGDYKNSGGSNIAAKNLITYLLSVGVEIHAVVRNQGDFKKWMESKGVKVYIVHSLAFYSIPSINTIFDFFLFPIRALRNIICYQPAIRGLRKIIRYVKPDIVHSNNSLFMYGYVSAKKEHIPHVWHLREYADCLKQLRPFPNLESLKLRLKKSYTISVSNDIAKYYSCNNPAKDIVVYDSVNLVKGNYCRDKGNFFLVVGSITEQKGIRDLICAFTKFANEYPEKELWIVGSGKSYYLTKLFSLVKSLGMQQRIKFLGFRKDVPELMAHAQALIVSSWVESFGLVTVEAMLSACLVIGKDVYGTKVLMNNCERCELPYITEDELVRCLIEVHTNGSEFYKDRVLKAQKIASKLYTVNNNGSSIYEFYKKILCKEDGSNSYNCQF